MSDVQPSGNASATDVERFLLGAASQVLEDPNAVSAAIVGQILAAKTAEEVLQRQTTVQATDVLGQRIGVRGVRWMPSTFADGPGFYALIEAVSDDGEPMLITCGSPNVMAQVFRLVELNALPCYAAIVQAEHPTAAGFYPMNMEGRTAP